jgi:hypothetical protein
MLRNNHQQTHGIHTIKQNSQNNLFQITKLEFEQINKLIP